jgi:hypothetical protein
MIALSVPKLPTADRSVREGAVLMEPVIVHKSCSPKKALSCISHVAVVTYALDSKNLARFTIDKS